MILLMQVAPLIVEAKPLNGRFLRPIQEAPRCDRQTGLATGKTIASSATATETDPKRKKKK